MSQRRYFDDSNYRNYGSEQSRPREDERYGSDYSRDRDERRFGGYGPSRYQPERGNVGSPRDDWRRDEGRRDEWRRDDRSEHQYFGDGPESRFEQQRGYYGSGGSFGYGGGFEYPNEDRWDQQRNDRSRREYSSFRGESRSEPYEQYGSFSGGNPGDYERQGRLQRASTQGIERYQGDRDDFRSSLDWGHSARNQAPGSSMRGQQRQERGQYYGRSPQGYTRSDDRIREDVCDRLMQGHIDPSRLTVRVSNGEVTVEGQVDNRNDKYHVEEILDQVLGVKDVDNRLRVRRQDDTSNTQSSARGNEGEGTRPRNNVTSGGQGGSAQRS